MNINNIARRLKEYFSTPNRQLLLFGAVHLLILLIWLNFSAFDIRIHPDVELYHEYGDLMFKGNLPYRDFAVEYPPLALLILLIPRLFSATLTGYADAFAVLMLAFDLLGLYFASRLSRRLGLGHFATLAIYSFSFFILGDIAINRFDVVPAVLSLGAIYYFLEKKNKTAWFVLALGVLAKLYPAIIAPLFIIPYLRKKEFKPLVKNLVIFVATGLVVALPFFIASPEGFWNFITFHSGRGLQLESGYASLLMLGKMLGLTQAEIVLAYSSVDIWAPVADFLIAASTFITLGGIFACYVVYFRRTKKEQDNGLVLTCFSVGVLAVLLVTAKIFSTQFVIWLYPLIPFINGKIRHSAWIMFALIGLLSQYIYPHNYGELMNFEQPAVIFLILRNLLVLALGIAAIYFAGRSPESKSKVKNRRRFITG